MFNTSKESFNELLQETLEEITLHCGLLVDEIAENVDDENKRKEMIDYVGKIDGAIYRFCNHLNLLKK
jgi:hypothetical protein